MRMIIVFALPFLFTNAGVSQDSLENLLIELKQKAVEGAGAPKFFLPELKNIAKDMEVFPVDFIAPDGPFSDEAQGRDWPNKVCRLDLTRTRFRLFYSFCDLALRATEEEIAQCMNDMEQYSPREKALVLTAVYMHAYPWREIPKLYEVDDSGRQVLTSNALLALRFPWLEYLVRLSGAFDGVHRIGTEMSPEKRDSYKRFIEKYAKDESIAFPAVVIAEEDKKNFRPALMFELKLLRATMADIDAESRNDGRLFWPAMKKHYPEYYRDYMCDSLFLGHVEACWPGLIMLGCIDWWDGTEYRPSHVSNSSETPKTVGQIAAQLLESWEMPEVELVPEPLLNGRLMPRLKKKEEWHTLSINQRIILRMFDRPGIDINVQIRPA